MPCGIAGIEKKNQKLCVATFEYRDETGAGGGERQNAEGVRLVPDKTDGARISSGVHARPDAETDARDRRIRREIHDRLPERISGRLV